MQNSTKWICFELTLLITLFVINGKFIDSKTRKQRHSCVRKYRNRSVPLSRLRGDVSQAEAQLGHCQTSMIELFC